MSLKKLEVLLVRHGESLANVDLSLYKSTPDPLIPLSEKGIAQAQETGVFINNFIHENNWNEFRVFTSSYDRAVQTMENVIDKIVKVPHKVKYDDRLREQSFGIGDGMTDEEFMETHPEVAKKFALYENSEAKYFNCRPGGESPADVGSRCRDVFESMIRDYDKHGINKFIIVCHGITLRAFMKEFLHPEDFRWYAKQKNPKNASVYHIKDYQSAKNADFSEREGCIFTPQSAM